MNENETSVSAEVPLSLGAKPWFILSLFTLCIMAGAWGLSCIPSLGPLIKEALLLSPLQIGALMVSFYIGTTVMAFTYSFFLDEVNVRTSMAIGLFVIGGFVFIAGMYLHYLWILLFLAIAGCGYGIINPAINKGIVAWFPAKLRATAMSVKQIGVMLGSGVSAALLPSLALHHSIHFSILFTGAVGILMGFFSFLLYRDKPIATMTNRTRDQIIDRKRLFMNGNLMLCNTVAMLLVGAQFSFFMYLSLYVREEFHYDFVQAGITLSFASLGGAIGRVFWGMVSDFIFKGNRKIVLIIIGIASFVFCLTLAWIPESISSWIMVSLVLAYGLTIGGWNGVIQAMSVELVHPSLAGVVSGFTLAFVYLATLVLPFFFGILIDWTDNYRLAWTISGCSVLLGTMLLGKIKEGIQ